MDPETLSAVINIHVTTIKSQQETIALYKEKEAQIDQKLTNYFDLGMVVGILATVGVFWMIRTH